MPRRPRPRPFGELTRAAPRRMPTPSPLDPATSGAAEELLRAGQAPNTVRSYASALRYWDAWMHARYGTRIAPPVAVAVVVQFIVDHVARERAGKGVFELPPHVDATLVRTGAKAALGALRLSTVSHRLAVLSKLHRLQRLQNPCEDARVRHLLAAARRGASRRGEAPRRKTAAVRSALSAMLATCDDSLAGTRDRALLLFAWSSGGRRRSEVAAASLEQLNRTPEGAFQFCLGHSKTRQSGAPGTQETVKPLRGASARALHRWLKRAAISRGAIFRAVHGHRLGAPLSAAAVGEIVKRRARLAGLDGDWGGHSLRSGFVTEAGRRKIPLGDVMALTEHRNPATVMAYYRAGELSHSEVARLYDHGEAAPRARAARRRRRRPDP